MRRAILLALATASVATAAMAAVNPAAAAPAGKATEQMSVKFGDLNLASRSGARALVSRIHVAANELCGPDMAGDLGRMADRARCVRDAQDKAIQTVGRPAVTAAYLDLPQPDAVALTSTSR